jgi:hypothetical protein
MRFTKLVLGLFIFAATLSGCATIFTGTSQSVNIRAVDSANNQPLKGVTCSITDGKGIVYAVPANPGSVQITKGHGALSPNCQKVGYIQKNFGVGEDFNAVTIVNILFWPGFIVDAMTGSMHKYPSHITVFMENEIK